MCSSECKGLLYWRTVTTRPVWAHDLESSVKTIMKGLYSCIYSHRINSHRKVNDMS
jgi:hypothetical protein